MKKILLAVSSLFLLGLNVASASELKIAVVDVRAVMQQSQEVKTVTSKLERDFKSRQEKIATVQKTLQGDVEKYERDTAVMKDAERQSTQKQIIEKRNNLMQMQQEFQQALSHEQNQAMQKFMEKMTQVVSQVATKEGYDLVLQKNAVPYVNTKLDITQQVIAKINQ